VEEAGHWQHLCLAYFPSVEGVARVWRSRAGLQCLTLMLDALGTSAGEAKSSRAKQGGGEAEDDGRPVLFDEEESPRPDMHMAAPDATLDQMEVPHCA